MLPPKWLKWCLLLNVVLQISCCFQHHLCSGEQTDTGSKNDDGSEEIPVEEFAHLLQRIEQSKRVHLVSELTRNGYRLQIEEFLDLGTWNQLIQFKWHEDEVTTTTGGVQPSSTLKTQTISLLVRNDGEQKVLIQYEPYSCEAKSFNSSRRILGADWRLSLKASLSMAPDDPAISARERHLQTIKSIMSTAPNSPFLARLKSSAAAKANEEPTESWIFGIIGAWVKAQMPGIRNGPPRQLSYEENGKRVLDSNSWRLDLLDADAIIMYYFNGALLMPNQPEPEELAHRQRRPQLSRSSYESVALMEVRGLQEPHVHDLINVITAEFDFSDKLAHDLFRLPIGFRCSDNPVLGTQLDESEFSAHDWRGSAFLELELVATKYKWIPRDPYSLAYSSTDIKNVALAKATHPLNRAVSVMMLHIREDRLKTVRDFHSRLRHTMRFNGSTAVGCEINRLHILDFDHRQAMDMNEICFDNGITINLSELFLDYLFSFKPANEENKMRLLNTIRVSPSKEELVFETLVSPSLDYLLDVTDSLGKQVIHTIYVVRVYERSLKLDSASGQVRRRGLLTLSRINLLIFDAHHQNAAALVKVGEIRINLIKSVSMLNFARKAQLFDVSPCYDLDQEALQMLVTYPAEPALLEYARKRSHELVEQFYRSSTDWWTSGGGDDKQVRSTADDDGGAGLSEKKRIGLSLNFLRVPRVELRSSGEDGELQLQLLVLDKASPIHSFDQQVESTFVAGRTVNERMLVGTAEECARFCQQFRCRMFAFDGQSRECKLSPVSVEDKIETSNSSNAGGSLFTADLDDEFAWTVRKTGSTVYYAPLRDNEIDSQAPVEEASLAELHSYLEHSVGELDVATGLQEEADNEEEDDDGDGAVGSRQSSSAGRRKRDARLSIDRWPLMSFQFADRSDTSRPYAPPSLRLMVPSDIRLTRVPISLDLSGEASQRVKVATAFRSSFAGKSFQLNLLDDWKETPHLIMEADERTFVDKPNSTYYTLKRFRALDLDTCALLCYNIEDWDLATGSEQTCATFSYCAFERTCILMIKTDFNYTKSLLELTNEGDIVHDISKPEELLVRLEGCSVSSRNYLVGFEGPMKLGPNYFGQETTKDIDFGSSIKYEWLAANLIESAQFETEAHENCAEACFRLNRIGKICMALDYCESKSLGPNNAARYQHACYLFMMEITNMKQPSTGAIGRVRNQLARIRSRKQEPEARGSDKKILVPTGNDKKNGMCQRYLVSHLSEYNHVKQRKLTGEFGDQLRKPAPTLTDLNLDNCAIECSLRQTQCLAFEYCSVLNEETKSVARNCSLFGAPAKRRQQQQQLWTTSATTVASTHYSSDCHVYLRREISSLDELLVRAPDQTAGNHSGGGLSEHKTLVVVFSISLVAVVAAVFLAYKAKFFAQESSSFAQRLS